MSSVLWDCGGKIRLLQLFAGRHFVYFSIVGALMVYANGYDFLSALSLIPMGDVCSDSQELHDFSVSSFRLRRRANAHDSGRATNS